MFDVFPVLIFLSAFQGKVVDLHVREFEVESLWAFAPVAFGLPATFAAVGDDDLEGIQVKDRPNNLVASFGPFVCSVKLDLPW
ncbi:hypothetical protein [Corynebacterium mastitidis]|uniref:hypothetical protein n=1 Tax=Corynebacterium mastitidis TaxID=161890 RepID=UPI00254AD30D|nr:hypothetical protein [Corynebacterium mastitidis]MDK8451555.1 hypothetical protein [Corynebacterium mastitidis]